MPTNSFHEKPFDEGTETKLQVFELYAREWLPVFLSRHAPLRSSIHLFDFFAGPGLDSAGTPGSPLRLLRRLRACQTLPGWGKVSIHLHFFDKSKRKIERLIENLAKPGVEMPELRFDVRPLGFDQAFADCASILADRTAAKLVFIDQFGVSAVTSEVFRELERSPTCDFLFFLSSSTLSRFHDHPLIKQKIDRPSDSYHVHRKALEHYRGLLKDKDYFLAPFSIKKGSNIYGIIFGSAHYRGIDKFLQVAWKKDEIAGEANFDIDRDSITPESPLLPFAEPEFRPNKITAFERELEDLLRSRTVCDESDVMRLCWSHGMTRPHATPVLVKLKRQDVIDLDFRVPDVKRMRSPRQIHRKG